MVPREQKWGTYMSNIDYGKLLGFQTVSDHLTGKIDFKDETLGTKLGAKVGQVEAIPTSALDHSKLLGFDTVTDELAAGIDFQNETLADKLGAKVGFEVAP